jgi:hypothetical protein
MSVRYQLVCERAGIEGETGVERTYSEPDNVVGISWETGAALVLLVSEGLDDDGVIQRAYVTILISINLLIPNS